MARLRGVASVGSGKGPVTLPDIRRCGWQLRRGGGVRTYNSKRSSGPRSAFIAHQLTRPYQRRSQLDGFAEVRLLRPGPEYHANEILEDIRLEAFRLVRPHMLSLEPGRPLECLT